MNIQISQGKCGNGMNRYKGGGIRYSSFSAVHLRMRQWKNNYYQKLSYCWETARRASMPKIAGMGVEMTIYAEVTFKCT